MKARVVSASAAIILGGFLFAGSASALSTCPTLTRTLSLGSRGADVTQLQQFLAQDSTIYPEASVSGYFGAATQRAVQRWQSAHGIVSSGTPSSTGYGAVGAKTRARIGNCTQSTTSPSTTATSTSQSVVPATATSTAVASSSAIVDPRTIPAITSFSISPKIITYPNDPVQISWTSSNTTTCGIDVMTATDTYSSLLPQIGINGTTIVNPAKDTTYSLACNGLIFDASSTPVTIRRNSPITITNQVPTCTVTTNASSYTYGGSIVISWTSTDAVAISWKRPNYADAIPLPVGNLYPSGSLYMTALAGANQSLTLNVSGPGGTNSCTTSFAINSASS